MGSTVSETNEFPFYVLKDRFSCNLIHETQLCRILQFDTVVFSFHQEVLQRLEI